MVLGLARTVLRPSSLSSAAVLSAASGGRLQSVRGFQATARARAVVVEDGKDPQVGDYPQPAAESTQNRKYDPRYWDTQEKRNFGEIPHEQDDILGVWAPDLHPNVEPSAALRQIAIAASIFAAFASLVYISLPSRPAVPRTYPRDGLADELGSKEVAVRKKLHEDI